MGIGGVGNSRTRIPHRGRHARRPGEAMSGWIKCSDRLPEVGSTVLAWNEAYGARESQYLEYGEGSIAHFHGYPPYFSWEEPQSSWASSWKPTHWQPLPSPPTE
ncbi:DUF551 domain-containing protein [Pseudomonas sp. 3HC3]|uniref:DUF551 domain-containing protein n=1 Tax=Pseudomonas sp. 3HC3 TaxID=2781025 RepID=UPI0038505EF6